MLHFRADEVLHEIRNFTIEAHLRAANDFLAKPRDPPGHVVAEEPFCQVLYGVSNENMQAYIADRDAGTYRQLVEAAESCQVSIIHPGKPRDPSEPNLEDLIARAEPFI